MMSPASSARPRRPAAIAPARGLTLVELLIALLLGLFLVGGLIALLQTMKRAATVQTGMSQLVDNERFALDLLTDVIQTAGDVDINQTNATAAFPAQAYTTTAPAITYTFKAQQVLAGTGAVTAVAPGDTFVIRTYTTGSDNLMNCIGATSNGVRATFVNVFSLDAANNLQCQVFTVSPGGVVSGPQSATLVTGIHNMQVSYGIKSNINSSYLAADAYLDATQINALAQSTGLQGWSMVRSLQLQLTFLNPLYGAPAQPPGTPQYITFTRVIDIMSATGVGET